MTIDANKDLALVRATGCQYIGDQQDPRQHQISYCGCKSLHKTSVYCEQHYSIMYQKGSALRKRKKDKRILDNKLDIESLFNEAVLELTAEGQI